jgi:hypothetical protein
VLLNPIRPWDELLDRRKFDQCNDRFSNVAGYALPVLHDPLEISVIQ